MDRPGSMKRTLLGAAAAAWLAAPALGQEPARPQKWYDGIGLSGYLQASYVGNPALPRSRTNAGRQFDTHSDNFSMDTFLLQVAKPVGEKDDFGFTARLRTGRDANILRAGQDIANTGADAAFSEVFLQEAYVTYVVPRLRQLSFTGGKFVTLEGYELADTLNNPNFSEGLLFTFAEPVTHTGVKAVYVFNDKVNATAGLVNGWDVTSDNNNAKTFIWQAAATPTKALYAGFQGTYGNELAAPSDSKRLSLDLVLGYKPTDRLGLSLQGNWGQQTKDPNTANASGTTHWSGLGAWASYATTERLMESVRFEVFEDVSLANRMGPGNGIIPGTGLPFTGPQTIREVTLTHKTMLKPDLGTRVEYRYDWSSEPFFERRDGTGSKHQNTVSADVFVTF